MNEEYIMDDIRKLAEKLLETTDKKESIELINKINNLKYKIINKTNYNYIDSNRALDLVGRFGT